MRQKVFDGDVQTGTIIDCSPYYSLINSGFKQETRKLAVSSVDDEGFVFMTESAAKFWLWLKSSHEQWLERKAEIEALNAEKV